MIRIGIIGGRFASIGLAPAFRMARNCAVVGVYSGRSDWRALIESGKLDAVALAVPPKVQYTIAKTAMENGLHVFAEKPFATNLADAKKLRALAKKKGIVHGIDFEFPEIAEWKKVKELLDRKAYGKLNHVSVSWDWMSGQLLRGKRDWKTSRKDGGGVLSYYFSHGLHYLEHFAGEITGVKSAFTYSPLSRGGAETGVDMLLAFKGGATGDAHVSCNAPGFIRHRLAFACERGVIVLEGKNAIVDGFTITVFTPKGAKTLKVRKDSGRRGEDERVKIVQKLAQRFVDACHGRGRMAPSFEDGLRVQELIERVRERTRR